MRRLLALFLSRVRPSGLPHGDTGWRPPAVRVVDGVHHDATDGRADALPAVASGLAPVDVRLLGVADRADGGAAANIDHAHLTRWHAERGVFALTGNQLDGRTGGTTQLGPTAGTQLHGVHGGADGDLAQLQVVARFDVGALPGDHDGALGQAVGGDDVPLLPVVVVQQRDPGSAVGVVLDVSDLRRNTVLVVALEVDDAVGLLVPATRVVAAAGLRLWREQRLLRGRTGQLDEVGDAGAATSRRRWLVFTDTHDESVLLHSPRLAKMSMCSPAATVTMARLTSTLLPMPKRVRRRFP